MSILKEITKRAKQVGKSVKKNYDYFKLGVKTEREENEQKARKKTLDWQANIRKGTPENNLK